MPRLKSGLPRRARGPAVAPDPRPIGAAEFPEALASLRAMAAQPHPDAALLLACDRFDDLWDYRERLYRRHAPRYLEVVREFLPEIDGLHARIASLPARTERGRIAKVSIALRDIGGGTVRKGSIYEVARAVLKECLANLHEMAGGGA